MGRPITARVHLSYWNTTKCNQYGIGNSASDLAWANHAKTIYRLLSVRTSPLSVRTSPGTPSWTECHQVFLSLILVGCLGFRSVKFIFNYPPKVVTWGWYSIIFGPSCRPLVRRYPRSLEVIIIDVSHVWNVGYFVICQSGFIGIVDNIIIFYNVLFFQDISEQSRRLGPMVWHPTRSSWCLTYTLGVIANLCGTQWSTIVVVQRGLVL